MRRNLLFITICLTQLALKAQITNTAQHYSVQKPGAMVSLNNYCYYLERIDYSCCNDSANLVCINNLGQIQYKRKLTYFGVNYAYKLLATNDGNILVGGYCFQACDLSSTKIFLTKFDPNGNVLFQNVENSPSSFFAAAFSCLTQGSDSLYYMAVGGKIRKYSKQGVFMSEFNTPYVSIHAIEGIQNGNLLLSASLSGSTFISVLNTSGMVLNQQNSTDKIIKLITLTGGAAHYALTLNGVMESYNSALAKTNSYGTSISDFSIYNDSLFITGDNFGNNLYYKILDLNFQELFFDYSGLKRVIPTGIAISGNRRLNIVTKGNSGSDLYMSFKGFFQLDFFDTFNKQPDIGIQRVKPLQYEVNNNFVYCNFQVTYKNYGSIPVTSFFVNHYASSLWCKAVLNKRMECQLNPGDTVQLSTGTFGFPLSWMNVGVFNGVKQICLFTSIPNDKNDEEPVNDGWCESFELKVVSDIQEATRSEKRLTLFPSPVREELNLTCEEDMSDIEVSDIQGGLIFTLKTNQKVATINMCDLLPGIYFVKVKNKSGTSITQKFIRE